MGANASEGVIDQNNKVFGYENLYIIDSSMTSANPEQILIVNHRNCRACHASNSAKYQPTLQQEVNK
jgi:hypothetical protein